VSGAALSRAVLPRKGLHVWQETAVAKALSSRTALFALIGAGKTITALTTIFEWSRAVHRERDGRRARVLLVAPAPVLDATWRQEAQRWEHTAHLDFCMTHRESGAQRELLWRYANVDVVTCTPDLLHKFNDAYWQEKGLRIDGVVVDESHLMKSPESRRTQALLKLCSNSSDRVLLMTGTPCPVGPQDLWTAGRILSKNDTTFWGSSYNSFMASRFIPTGDYSFAPKSGQTELINAEIGRYALSIGDARPPGVPEPTLHTHRFEWEPEVAAQIAAFVEDRTLKIGDWQIDAPTDGGYLSRLAQLTQGFVYRDDASEVRLSNRRLDCLDRILRRIDTPVLVAVRFRADVLSITERFPHAVTFTGETKPADRIDIIDRWNRDEIKLLVASPQTMGVGLNLQHGSSRDIVWFGHTWDAALRAQFEGRLIRSGQRFNVRVHDIVADVGLDDAIVSLQARKTSGQDALLSLLHINKKVTK